MARDNGNPRAEAADKSRPPVWRDETFTAYDIGFMVGSCRAAAGQQRVNLTAVKLYVV
jgi:hypothetical protein